MNTYVFLAIIVSVLVGLLFAFIAKRKNKNPAVWFDAGVILTAFIFWLINEAKKRKKGGRS